ncbi:hypothetical protein BG011_003607 [Mortierella polycephala]|uniref:Uncharacterized protein n=1 Tax=Mortierella polycephala TaxID=41804 RepID=A0A9P6Q0H2_9FUNG|nr:hypothetical protein BG011_003607 [Mortierella polycephala]
MKWDHDSDSEDAVMIAATPESGVNAHCSKEARATRKALTSSLPIAVMRPSTVADAKLNDPSANERETTEGKASPMTVEAAASDTPQHDIRTITPPVSTSSTSSASSTESPVSPSQAFGDGMNTDKESMTRTIPTSVSIPLGSQTNTSQSSHYSCNRTGPWPYSSSSSASSSASNSYSGPTLSMSSLIQSKESVYAAVPVSSELYIIPKSSRGFHWNGDLFLKPHQRRSLGVDHMFNTANQRHQTMTNDYYNSGYGSGNSIGGASYENEPQQNQHHHNQDSSVMVHEIRLDEHEIAGILPSWP